MSAALFRSIAAANAFEHLAIPRMPTSANSLLATAVWLAVQSALSVNPAHGLSPRLTSGSSRLLRSLGRHSAAPLTKSYVLI